MIDSLSASLRPISLLQSILDTIVKVILIKKIRYIMSFICSISFDIFPAHSEWSPIRLHWPGRPDLIPWGFADLSSYHVTPHLIPATPASLPGTLTPHVFCTCCFLTLKFFLPMSVRLASSSPYSLTLFSPSHLLPWGIADVLFIYSAYCLPSPSPK